uniref:Uncharacterized protein n=1 Tax=Polytomella parva TaxID=51329 RepID=A0A7S0UR74_9CHLO|mmetsp:Transcript_18605/g.33800  ORF Transcript_18605/g.33800 Transcript_18605/m.33800 type:complete len:146 (+) Transcript_18605:314-751(+)|eukprot:CAMPEP_0175058188 /NCGR_PEP_ID=MMETSP0052_2-20121109/11703_1 /TAXON_ID=51329 ORGANISM="Polytomella parva, Strain SAG 63-3" /NCGR_SAMPLE_ID=MMETSP0052_2 /ASSEMBLY_ACC=CAM_ASM_000194 /LENGTH=145 /DNA_ID=CAMNT_0016323529 /DNA_START=294 /DNA_END=731 /DNA_ORIENTATION=-
MDSNNDFKNASVKRKRIIPVNVAPKEEELNQINVPQYIGSLQVIQNVSESNLCGVLNNTSLDETFLSKAPLHAKAKAEVDILSVFNASRSDEWCPPSVEQAQKDLLQPGRRVQVNLSESCIVDYAKLSGKLSRNKGSKPKTKTFL